MSPSWKLNQRFYQFHLLWRQQACLERYGWMSAADSPVSCLSEDVPTSDSSEPLCDNHRKTEMSSRVVKAGHSFRTSAAQHLQLINNCDWTGDS